MKTDYGYPEFKQKLVTNPKWIARGLTVLAHSGDIATPKNIVEIMAYIDVIQSNGRICPEGVEITRTRPSEIVSKHAVDLFRYYRKHLDSRLGSAV